MKFKNRPNKCYQTVDGPLWASRSVAINLIVLAKGHVLCSRRGPNAADFRGYYNLVAGYLDWDETAPQAAIRECWEEVGLDLTKYDLQSLHQPWHVASDPAQNRQNVSLRFGVTIDEMPSLTTKYNEVQGEVEDPRWLPIEEIDKLQWAFNHDLVIKEYLKKKETYNLGDRFTHEDKTYSSVGSYYSNIADYHHDDITLVLAPITDNAPEVLSPHLHIKRSLVHKL